MSEELARETLEAELGRRTEEVFAEFAWEPLAAASIGQVHRARLLDGQAVAVKIQYPGVAAAIRADLKNSELLATFLHRLISTSPRRLRLDPRAMAREVGRHIEEELDYRLEASRQREFASLYRGHPFIHVPEVIDALSTDRILTQQLVEGLGWEEPSRRRPSSTPLAPSSSRPRPRPLRTRAGAGGLPPSALSPATRRNARPRGPGPWLPRPRGPWAAPPWSARRAAPSTQPPPHRPRRQRPPRWRAMVC